jgi:uncharacterized damage-inducible protein DinB
MLKEYFELLVNYNKEANNSLSNIIMNFTEDQWKRQFSGYYKSIHEICSHIYFWDLIHLKRFRLLRDFVSLTDKNIGKDFSNNLNEYLKLKNELNKIFLNINEHINLRNNLDNIIANFINELTEIDIDAVLKFKTPEGKFEPENGLFFEKKMSGLLIHYFDHGTHHRGMISVYLDMIGIENDFSNDMFKYY